MLYQDTKRYLKHTFSKPSSDFKWTPLSNINFLSYLEEKYDTEMIEKEMPEIKLAFKDFFESVGNVMFRYKQDVGIQLRILPYSVSPKDSKHLKNIIKIIQHNHKYIKHPYNGQENQIGIMGKIRREINQEIYDTDESVNKKELIKYALKKALDLDEKDVIVQLKRNFIVKLYDKSLNTDDEDDFDEDEEIDEAEEVEVRRYNGYTEDQIEDTYNEIVERENSSIKPFLNSVMYDLFEHDLNFREIDNRFFEANALKMIHARIVQELTNYVSFDEDYLIGLASYILRRNFEEIHSYIVFEILQAIYKKSEQALKFLLFYDGRTVLIKNKKYKIPQIEDPKGNRWNISSMVSISNAWFNAKQRVKHLEDHLSEIQDEIDVETENVRTKNLSGAHAGRLEFLKDREKKLLSDLKAETLGLNAKQAQINQIVDAVRKTLVRRKKLVESVSV